MNVNLWNRLFRRSVVNPNTPGKRTHRYRPQLVTLEDRVVPATISLVGGNLTYTGTNVANTLALSLADPTYTFKNLVDTFTGTAPTGVTYQDLDTNGSFETAIVDTALVNQLNLNLGTSANTVNLGGFDANIDPLNVVGGGNAASTLNVIVGGQGITTTGNVSFTGFNSINVLNQITAANVTLQADQMTISQPINAGTGNIQIATKTAARPIQLGAASNAAHLGLTQAQLNNLAANLVSIGVAASGGAIDVVAANTTLNSATLALNTNSTISGAGTLTVTNLAFTATGNVDLTGTWSKVVGTSGGSINLDNSQNLAVDTVNAINVLQAATTISITVDGSLTVAKNITSTGASAVTLTTNDTAATADITVNTGVTISSAGGDVKLDAGDNLTVNAGATLQTTGAGKILLNIDVGNADAGTGAILQTTGSTISAPAGATFTGNADNDQFFVSSSANTAISVDGQAGNNTLEFSGGGLAIAIGTTTLTAFGRQPVTFANIVGPIKLVNSPSVSMQGTAGADNLELFGTATGVEVSLNAGIRFDIGNAAFSFDGLTGVNTVTFDNLNGNASPAGGTNFTNVAEYTIKGSNNPDVVELTKPGAAIGFTFNGGAFTALPGLNHFTFQGRNGDDTLTVRYGTALAQNPVPAGGIDYAGEVGNDKLAVLSPVIIPGRSGSYLPGAVNGDGRVTVGAGQIRFTSLSPVDVSGMTDFNVEFPGGNELLTLSAGTGFTDPHPAIHVSGTSGGVGFEEIAIWDVTNLTVDTSTNVQGADDILVTGTGTGHNVTNLTLKTGDNNDSVTFAGSVNLAGNLLLDLGNNDDTITGTGAANLLVGGNIKFDLGNDKDTSNFAAGSKINAGVNFDWLSGNGDDAITSRAAITVGGIFKVDSGDGDNNTNFAAGSVTVTVNMDWLGGAGDDTNTSRAVIDVGGTFKADFGAGTNNTDFAAGSVSVTGAMSWLGGAGDDTFSSSVDTTVGGSFTINPGDGANTTTLVAGKTTDVTGNVVITGGVGVDTVSSNGSLTVGGSLTANLGGSGDQLSVATTTVTGAITIDGQTASDTVNINGVTSGSGVSITAETINIKADLTATTTTVDLLNATTLNVAGVTVKGQTGITQTGNIDAVHLTGVGPVLTTFTSPAGFINFASNINGTTAGTQQLNVHANGVVTLQNIGDASVPANAVRLGDFNVTSDIGFLFLQGASYFAGPQTYTSPTTMIVVANNVLFDGVDKDITFNCAINALANDFSNVSVFTTGVTTFNGPIGNQLIGTFPLRSLSTNFGGSTRIKGGLVKTTRFQDYEDDVLVSHTSGLTTLTTTLNGAITFGQTLNAGSDVQDLTLDSGTGAISFKGNVGNLAARLRDMKIVSAGDVLMGTNGANTFKSAGFNQLAGSGITTVNANTTITNSPASSFTTIANITNDSIILNNNFNSEQNIRFNPNLSGVTQNAGSLTTERLIFAGTGTFNVDQLSNVVKTDFEANVNGDIFLAAQKLVISQSGVVTSNDDVTLRTATNFTATPNTVGGQLISLGTGDFQLFHGLTGNSVVLFDTEITAATVNLGAPPATPLFNSNVHQDTYRVLPSKHVEIFVWGNIPNNNLDPALNDVLLPNFATLDPGETVTLTGNEVPPNSGSIKGEYTFSGTTKTLNFFSIERFGDLKITATVAQTTVNAFTINLTADQGQTNIDLGLPPVILPSNTFIVNPRFVNPVAPFGAPRIAMGDVNGDGFDDLVLGAGSNQSPLVFVIDGQKLTNFTFKTGTENVDPNQPLPQSFFLAKFLAYEPNFMGGVNVAVGKLNKSNPRAEIVVAPGAGRPPEVKVFEYNTAKTDYRDAIVNYPVTPLNNTDMAFYAYDSTYKGGVRVAVRTTGNAENQIVTAPAGAGTKSVIRLFTPSSIPTKPVTQKPSKVTPPFTPLTPYSDISPNFSGGLYIATGDYSPAAKDDILVGPGNGLPSRIRVFNGDNLLNKEADFVAFGNERPSGTVSPTGSTKAGVGSVAFSKNSTGQPVIIVGSAPGQETQIRVFEKTTFSPDVSVGVASNPNVFTILKAGAVTGTWKININGKSTADLAANISANNLKAAIGIIPDFDAGNVVSVEGTNLATTGFTITFVPSFVQKFLPVITFTSNLVGPVFNIKPSNQSAMGSWKIKIDTLTGTFTSPSLSKFIKTDDLKAMLNAGMIPQNGIDTITRAADGSLQIVFDSDYWTNNNPTVTVTGSMAGKTTNSVALAGAFSTSTVKLQDFLGNYFKYDALLIKELVQNRFRDGAQAVTTTTK